MADRDRKGRFAVGNTLSPGGLSPREIKAKRALRLQMAQTALAAGQVIDRAIAGEEVSKSALDAAKYVTDQVIGKATNHKTVEGSVSHQHTVDVGANYLAAMKSLASIAREERVEAMKQPAVIDVTPDPAKDQAKLHYSERTKGEEQASG